MNYGTTRRGDFWVDVWGMGDTIDQHRQIVDLTRTAMAQARSGLYSAAQASYFAARGAWEAAGSPANLADNVETARILAFGETPALEVAERDELTPDDVGRGGIRGLIGGGSSVGADASISSQNASGVGAGQRVGDDTITSFLSAAERVPLFGIFATAAKTAYGAGQTAGTGARVGAEVAVNKAGEFVGGVVKDAKDAAGRFEMPWGKLALAGLAVVAVNAFFSNVGRRR